jgi:hypothetical protein
VGLTISHDFSLLPLKVSSHVGRKHAGEQKANILAHMDVRHQLNPKQVLDVLARQVRKRIGALEGVRLSEYTIALYELRVVLDLLQRAAKYIERGEGKR